MVAYAKAKDKPPRVKRHRMLVQKLRTERASWITHWRDIEKFVLPRRGRFLGDPRSQVNRGDKRHQAIIDNTGSRALEALAAGMLTGMTSPARPWFKLTMTQKDLNDRPNVKRWLADCEASLRDTFARSDFYRSLHSMYYDLGGFGTAAGLLLEDEVHEIRTQPLPIGSYMLSCNAAGRVDTFVREWAMTVRQIVEEFCTDKSTGEVTDLSVLTESTRNLWKNGNTEEWINVCQVIEPNALYRDGALDIREAKYASCTFERDTQCGDDVCYLRESGFHTFPVLAPRWMVTGEDVYGSQCPGMNALGDIQGLQWWQRTKAKGVEKQLDPPLQGGPELRNSTVSTLPGGFTTVANVQTGFIRPIYQAQVDLQGALQDIEDHRERIKDTYFATLFRMMSDNNRSDITATEIRARQQEQFLQLGPVVESVGTDLLAPAIERTMDIKARNGTLPPPPAEIQGKDWKVEFTSIMAEAQKLAGIGAIERAAGFVASIVQQTQDPTAFDRVDVDETITAYFDGVGAPPRMLRSDDQVAAIRSKRAQQQQQAHAAAIAQQASVAAKNLAQTPLDNGDSALARLTGNLPIALQGSQPTTA
jgi:hypothetical protein